MTVPANRPLPDAEARRRAATDFETNLVVLAGAGTGKTSLLVERLLVAIGSEIAPISRLAAITFTDKAAGEMRQRLALGLERLRALARGEPVAEESTEADRAFDHLLEQARVPREQIARLALTALEHLDRAAVTTIHGFCSELLREHPVLAGVDPFFQVDSGEHAQTLTRSCWETFATHELGPDARRPELWKNLLSRLSLGAIGEVARQMVGFRIPSSVLDSNVPDALELLVDSSSRIAASIKSLTDQQEGMTPLALTYFASARRALDAFGLGGLSACHTALDADPALTARLDGGQLPRPTKKLAGVSAEEFKSAVADSSALLRSLYRIDEQMAGWLVEAVAPFVTEFREAYLRQGHLSFDGLLALTLDLLKDNPAVRRGLQRKYRMVMVDEFQDTDPVQHRIVMLLAGRPDGKPTDEGLDAGRLFVVGDAKQSIYRFRGADYSAYRGAVKQIVDCGGAELHLTTNFRSFAEVLGPVNDLFVARDSCWAASRFQPDYVPITAVRAVDTGATPPVEVWTVALNEGVLAEERREAEGRLIADEIERIVEQERRCDYAEITILFRAFTRISHYLRPLRQRGIPFVVDGGKDFLERPEVGQLIATLRTLAQPGDPAALLAFLRSPAGGISDTQLQDYAAQGGRWSWRSKPDVEHFPDIAERFEFLRDLALETRQLPADSVVRRVVDRALHMPLGAAAFEGAQRVANLRKLSTAAGDLARDGSMSLEQVVEALEDGRIANLETDPPLTDDTSRAVRITSIHRMKGLENRWIILPDLARMEARGFKDPIAVSLARLPEGEPALALSVGGATNITWPWLEQEDLLHATAEEVRVLYVALTRARDRLILVAGRPRHRAPWISALAPWDYDPDQPPEDGALLAGGQVLHRRLTPGTARRRLELPAPETTHQSVSDYESARARLRELARPPFVAPSGLERHAPSLPFSAPRSGGRDLGKAVGIVVHRLLATDGVDPTELARGIGDVVVAVAAESGVDASALSEKSEKLFASFLASPLAAYLREVETLGREVPLLLREEDGRVYRGSIDLLYRDSEGHPVVADYKTDHDTDETRLREIYREQLRVYARAVEQAFDLSRPPRSELWLVRSGRRVAIN